MKGDGKMSIQNEFAVHTDDKNIVSIGKSEIKQPEIKFDSSQSGIKWFDDSLLIKGKSQV